MYAAREHAYRHARHDPDVRSSDCASPLLRTRRSPNGFDPRGNVQNVEFVCLAAGRGTRFGQLGSYLQKAMYPVGLRPFVAYSVRNLALSGAFDPDRDRLTFVVGHHAGQVRTYFGDRYATEPAGGPELHVGYLEQDEPLGTGHALHLAYEALRPAGPMIAWLADLYVPRELFARMRSHGSDNVLAIAPDPEHENPNVAVTREGDRVVEAWQGRDDRYDIGLWKFAPAVLAAMLGREVDEFRALPSLQREIAAGRADVGWVEADEWLHLGGTAPTPEENVRSVVRRLFELEPAR